MQTDNYLCNLTVRNNCKIFNRIRHMKLRNLFLGAAAAVAMFAACAPETENLGTPSITISESTMEFEVAGGEQSLSLKATRDWEVTGVPAWLSVSPEAGEASADEQTVVVTALANDGGNRNADLKFTIGTLSKTLKVSQAGEGGNVAPEPGEGMTPIADVLAATGALPAGTKIQGVVISNMALNNLTSKKGMYVQDATAGLQFYLGANHTFAYGTMVEVDLSGVTLSKYNGAIQVNGLTLDKITAGSTGNVVDAKTVTMADFLANKYEGQYVALEGVQVKAADLSKTWVVGDAHTSINFEDANGNSFVVFSSKYATYKDQTVAQGSGTIKGISSINNGTMQIIFTQESDFADLTGDRFDGVTPPAGGEEGGDDTGDDNTGGQTPVTGNHADFETLTASKYYEASTTTTNGWVLNNCQVHTYGTANSNDTFAYVPEGTKAACMNGKTSAAGTITSPVIAGGCGSLSFSYCHPFSESNGISFKVEVLQNDVVVNTINVEKKDAVKLTPYTHTAEVNITGDFKLKFVNNSPTNNSSSNKDRYSVWGITWTSKAE